MKKAQAAMEFLMTYGWAILVVLVAIASLAYFGVLSPEQFLPERCIITSGSGLFCEQFSVSQGEIKLRIRNILTDEIEITQASISKEGNSCSLLNPVTIPADSFRDITLSGGTCNALTMPKTKLKGDIYITFTKKSFPRTASGSLVGKIAEAISAPSCGNGICEAGDGNCLADVGDCIDNVCSEPVCNDGCSEVEVAQGGNDEACYGSTGCSGSNCFCDGSGSCVPDPCAGITECSNYIDFASCGADNCNVSGTGSCQWDSIWLYQEDPNTPVICNGWNETNTCANTYDGDWNTYGSADTGTVALSVFNYTKPAGATSESKIQIKITSPVNVSIPPECWDSYPSIVRFNIHIENDMCLTGETLVQIPYGVKKIKDIKVNDSVISWDAETEQFVVEKVKTTSSTKAKVYLLETENNRVNITGLHPILAEKGYVKVVDLKEGDYIYVKDGYSINLEKITRKELLDYYFPVYSFETENIHSFVANNIVVHNQIVGGTHTNLKCWDDPAGWTVPIYSEADEYVFYEESMWWNKTGCVEPPSCTNDTGCSSVGSFCDGNIPYTCSLVGGCLNRVNGTECGAGEICKYGICKDIYSVSCSGDWNSSYPCSNVYDGNWNTYGDLLQEDAKSAAININYTKPIGVTSQSKWQVKCGSPPLITNFTIVDYSTCWQQDPLQFRISMTKPPGGPSIGYGFCWNGATWWQMTNCDEDIYEEVMCWNGTNCIEPSINWCYQETANESTACGGLATGSYAVTTGAYGWPGEENLYDGNWSSYSYAYYQSGGGNGWFYINYTKPSNALDSSLWQIKHVSSTKNLSINPSCWNQNPLQFRVQSYFRSLGDIYYTNWTCYDSTNYITMEYNGVSGIDDSTYSYVYEEAMWWRS